MSSTAEPAAVAIRAETPVADPNACNFIVAARPLIEGEPAFFGTSEDATGSPLAERLFAIRGVRSVLVSGNVVTVGKAADAEWTALKAAIAAAIREQLRTGIPAVLADRGFSGRGDRGDAELRAVVQRLLDREVNKSIAAHGGAISIVDVRDGVLSITMTGGCQGCAASQVTLRQGFESMVRKVAPEIRRIVDTTDHAGGAQPFYPRAGS